ncbi:MAG: gamma-glutamyltransferase [Gammaproteobacteria bacterium]
MKFSLVKIQWIAAAGLLLLLLVQTVFAGPDKSAVASAHPLATDAGFEILDKGGNAFDAAVAVSAALAVVEPTGSGLGGGGFWLLHRESDGFETMVDGREKAPLAANRNMYLNEDGEYVPESSKNGALAAGVPGLPAALVHLSEKYGRLPLAEALKPAIRYARLGFVPGESHRRMLGFRLPVLKSDAEASSIFLANGNIPAAGRLLIQPDLAATLEILAATGSEGFYGGEIARRLVDGVRASGGIWTLKDLADYKIVEREPVRGRYRNIRITGAAPPSSGGIVMIETLNILSNLRLHEFHGTIRKHLIVEAMRRAFRDRAMYLGDPDFVDIPVALLLNPAYAAGLSTTIRPDRALPSLYLAGDGGEEQGGSDTTHFSIIDGEGNRVAATLSINYPFGSGVVPPGTGVLLNNEMDDFVSLIGASNGYGLTGGEANAIGPGKRMLSSMSPTFLEDEGRVAVLGTPGGSRIISMVLLAVLDFAEGRQPDSWVSLPRFHHQYLPDEILYEKGGLTTNETETLSALGHRLKEKSYRYGNMQVILWEKDGNRVTAASDPRGEGAARVK